MKILFCLCLIFLVFVAGCSKENGSQNNEVLTIVTEFSEQLSSNSNDETKYYSLEDFSSIVIGESTIDDVNKIVPIKDLFSSSYGGFYECPTEDGKCIRIEFHYPDFLVGNIVVGEPTIQTTT